MQETDEWGIWEVTEGGKCRTRTLVEPSQQFLDWQANNPPSIPRVHSYSAHYGIVDSIGDIALPQPVRVNISVEGEWEAHDCFITEWVKEYYIQGHKLMVGDRVMVYFLENNVLRPVLFEKLGGSDIELI